MKIGLVDLVQFLVGYSFFLISASVHESSHAWTAFRFGDPTAKLQNRISLNPANHIDIVGTVIIPFAVFLSGIPIIGWAKPTPVNPENFSNPRRDGMYVSGAGPVSNLLVVALLAILWHVSLALLPAVGKVAVLFCYVFGVGILINLSLAIFNMMPVHPLDGSGVLEGLLPEQWANSYARLRPFGFIILLVLFYLPGFQRIIWSGVAMAFQFLGIQYISLNQIWGK
jgi:Zn-dependent protease